MRHTPSRNVAAGLFLAPFLIVFALFWVWPIISSFLYTLTDTRTSPPSFDPTTNWSRLLVDPAFANALRNTLVFMVIQVPVMVVLATVLAAMLNSSLLKAKAFVRFAFFAPVVVGEVAYAAVFRLIFNADFGAVNRALGAIGLAPVDWFSNPTAAMSVIIMAVTWRWVGYNAIIILSGMQSIPPELYEAATLDRVSRFRQFVHITVPLLKPVILFCLVLSIIGSLQLFAEPYLITNRGGPGGAAETLGYFVYRQGFAVFNFGYASAVAYCLTLIAVLASLANLWLGRERP